MPYRIAIALSKLKEVFMRKILFVLALLILMAAPVCAAQSTIKIAEGSACMGDDKSRKQTETAALTEAKRNAVESVRTYVSSATEVKDFELQKDLVSAYSNATVEVIETLEKSWYPVLSFSFQSVEGPRAVVIHHPVFSKDRIFSGSVSALFAPEHLLSSMIGPISAYMPVSIFLMQTDGLFIYDVDTKQIGLNIFTDPLYKPFPELVALCRRMAAVRERSGVYRFYRKVGEAPITKAVEWRTVELHGTPWRLAVAFAKYGVGR